MRNLCSDGIWQPWLKGTKGEPIFSGELSLTLLSVSLSLCLSLSVSWWIHHQSPHGPSNPGNVNQVGGAWTEVGGDERGGAPGLWGRAEPLLRSSHPQPPSQSATHT